MAKHVFGRFNTLIPRHMKGGILCEKELQRSKMYKVGKNNPKAEQIQADNKARTMWNQTVDRALVSGVPEEQIMEVKQKEIGQKAKASIQKSGRNPALFKES